MYAGQAVGLQVQEAGAEDLVVEVDYLASGFRGRR